MKRFIYLFLLLLTCIGAYAQVSFSVKAPQRVRQGDKFPVTYVLKNANGSSIKVGEIQGCTLLYGPTTSTSQSTQIIGGQMSSSMTIEYTYYYRADKVGNITIPEATIRVDNKTLRSNAATISVAQGSQQQQSQQQSQRQSQVDIYDADTQQAGRPVASSDVFVRIVLSKSQVYEQEAVVCDIKLYTKYGISAFIPTRQPAFDNFLIEELDVSNQMNIEETYNGQTYMTATLKRCILFPQKTGKLNINSGNYDVTIVQYEPINMGLFSVNQPRERQIKISSNSVSLNVNPLPEPRPAGFEGAVGTFSAESHLVGNSFKTGEPGSLLVTIKGTGNIKYLKEPTIDFPTQFEVYDPTSNINAAVSGQNVSGTVSVDYTFVPQNTGDFTIPATPFVYFNPSSARYETIELPGYNIKVAQGKTTTAGGVSQNEIDAQVKDIRYIDTAAATSSIRRSHTPVIRTPLWWICIVAPALVLIAVIAAARRRGRLNADVTGRKLAKANKVARKRLKDARKAADNHNSELFYDEMLRAIWGYLSDKLSIPSSQLSRDNIADELHKHGCEQTVVDRTIALIDECEMAKYAPAQSDERLLEIYSDACSVIDSIEHTKLKK